MYTRSQHNCGFGCNSIPIGITQVSEHFLTKQIYTFKQLMYLKVMIKCKALFLTLINFGSSSGCESLSLLDPLPFLFLSQSRLHSLPQSSTSEAQPEHFFMSWTNKIRSSIDVKSNKFLISLCQCRPTNTPHVTTCS